MFTKHAALQSTNVHLILYSLRYLNFTSDSDIYILLPKTYLVKPSRSLATFWDTTKMFWECYTLQSMCGLFLTIPSLLTLHILGA